MLLASQYYRPPFPESTRWRQDMQDIRKTGLDAIGLWAVWAWIEAEPGRFVYDDFDELVAEAARSELKVIITSVAELNPYWIHRVVPGSQMVDHAGHPIQSTNLSYAHQALAPGGCIDHPGVKERQALFLRDLGAHFAATDNLLIWDCWNEIRWSVQTHGYACFCEHTLAAFRDWLRAKYQDLDGLNRAWRRRYICWEDVDAGRQPGGAWVETIEYLDFLAWRSAEHATFRADNLRAGDPNHDVMAHSVVITPFHLKGESQYEQYLSRGNTFEIAKRVDAFGVSNFPGWFHGSPAEQGARIESARGAAGVRPLWISELQGGAAMSGIVAMQSTPADVQQRWLWNSYGRGAKSVNFWCWRDEVFGRESSGFGIVGDDGHAEARVAALTHSARVLSEHSALFDGYRPAPARVGVLFEPSNYLMEWSFYGFESGQAEGSVNGYLLGLERLHVPYDVLDASALPALGAYRMLFMPWTMIVREETASSLEEWVRAGGTLLVETETGAFNELGFYIYADERPFPRALGFRGLGRRQLDTLTAFEFDLDGVRGAFPVAGWIEPLEAATGARLITLSDQGPITVELDVGSGRVVVVGTHAGLANFRERHGGFETFLREVIRRAGAEPELSCADQDGDLQWRYGQAFDKKLLFVTNEGGDREVVFRSVPGVFGRTGRPSVPVEDLVGAGRGVLSGGELRVRVSRGGAHVFVVNC